MLGHSFNINKNLREQNKLTFLASQSITQNWLQYIAINNFYEQQCLLKKRNKKNMLNGWMDVIVVKIDSPILAKSLAINGLSFFLLKSCKLEK